MLIIAIIFSDVLIKWMDKYLKLEKSVVTAQHLREAGNAQFAQKNYISCIKNYTNSILNCPSGNTNEISLAYANRSAALFQLELYADCISDIDSAISHHYPVHLLPKILIRKIKSLKNLGKMEDCATVSLELDSAMKNLQLTETKTSKTKELLKEIENISSQCSNNGKRAVKDNASKLTEVPSLLWGENPLFKHSSSALDVR